MKSWARLRQCLANECDIWTHASPLTKKVARDEVDITNRDEVLVFLDDHRELSAAHNEAVERYSEILIGRSFHDLCIHNHSPVFNNISWS